MTEYLYAGNIYDTEDKKSCFSQDFSGIEGQSEMVHLHGAIMVYSECAFYTIPDAVYEKDRAEQPGIGTTLTVGFILQMIFALMACYVDVTERSRIYALYNVLMIGISSPFGSIIGWMFDVNPGLPFVFNIVMFTIGIMLTAGSKDLRECL